MLVMATACTSPLTPSIEPIDGFIGETATDGIQQDVQATDLQAQDVQATDLNDLPGDLSPDIPVDTGYKPANPKLAAWLQAIIDEYITFTGEPGASLTVTMPENARFSGAAGMADLEKQTTMAPGAAFRVGSTTKPFIAVVILQLVDEGKIGLDQPISHFIPGYPKWKAVTIRDLLDMRSGIPDYISEQALWLKTIGHPGTPIKPEALLAYVKDKPLVFQPGTGCGYSDTNYILLGMLIEKITGKTAAEEIDSRVVKPLGLKHTYLETGNENDPLLVHGYIHPKQAFLMLGMPMAALALIPKDLFIKDDLIDSTRLFPPSMVWTAGGLVTTTQDMVLFMKTLLDGGLMSPESLKAMTTLGSCTILGQNVNYGLGIIGYNTPLGMAYGHGGMTYGYASFISYVPDADIAISHMHNSLPEQANYLSAEVLKIIMDTPKQDPSVCTLPKAMSIDPSDPGLTLRFKGKINADNAKSPLPGLGDIRLLTNGKWNALYGVFTSAQVTIDKYSTRLEIDSYGPAVTNKSDMSGVVISVDAKALARAGQDGDLSFDKKSPYDIVALVEDIWVDKSTNQPNRACVTDVLDINKASDLYFCDINSVDISQGKLVKFFGRLSLTNRISDINAYMNPFGMARCNCPDKDGKWSACP